MLGKVFFKGSSLILIEFYVASERMGLFHCVSCTIGRIWEQMSLGAMKVRKRVGPVINGDYHRDYCGVANLCF